MSSFCTRVEGFNRLARHAPRYLGQKTLNVGATTGFVLPFSSRKLWRSSPQRHAAVLEPVTFFRSRTIKPLALYATTSTSHPSTVRLHSGPHLRLAQPS